MENKTEMNIWHIPMAFIHVPRWIWWGNTWHAMPKVIGLCQNAHTAVMMFHPKPQTINTHPKEKTHQTVSFLICSFPWARKAVEQLEVMQKQGDRDDGNTLESFRWRIESQWGLCLFVWASKASENFFHFWNAPKKIHWKKWVLFAFWPTGKKPSSLVFRKVETRWVCFSRLASPKLCWSTKVGKDCFSDVSFGNPRVSPMESPPVFPGGGREQWASEFGGLGTRAVPGVHPTSLTYGRLIFALEA